MEAGCVVAGGTDGALFFGAARVGAVSFGVCTGEVGEADVAGTEKPGTTASVDDAVGDVDVDGEKARGRNTATTMKNVSAAIMPR